VKTLSEHYDEAASLVSMKEKARCAPIFMAGAMAVLDNLAAAGNAQKTAGQSEGAVVSEMAVLAHEIEDFFVRRGMLANVQ